MIIFSLIRCLRQKNKFIGYITLLIFISIPNVSLAIKNESNVIQNLTIEARATTAILSWMPPDNSGLGIVQGYNIYRRTEESAYEAPIGYTGIDSFYIDSRLEMETTYYYKIAARIDYQEIGQSDEISITTFSSQDKLYTYANLKTAVIIYKNTNAGTIADNDIPRIINGIEVARLFIWRNSNMKLNLQITYYEIDDYKSFGDMGDYWGSVQNTTDHLKELGVMNTQYDIIYSFVNFVFHDYDFTKFSGGSGTQNDPYLIETPEQLDNVRRFYWAHFLQMADIDLGVSPWNTGRGWLPIGDDYKKFTGSYDGNGFTISNLIINRPDENWIGLLGYSHGAKLRNIVVTQVDVTGGSFVGALVGKIQQSTLSDNYVDGIITGNWNVGGLVGESTERGTINGSSANMRVVCNNRNGGGLVGSHVKNSEVNNSYATGNVSGGGSLGGLVGDHHNSLTNNSFATGNILGSDIVMTANFDIVQTVRICDAIPSEFYLYQNYPNPFNSTTTIVFALPSEVIVNFEIFNTLGQRITAIINGEQYKAGMYEAMWNARDGRFRELPSGIYYYRIKAGNFVYVKKMILLR